MMADSDDDTGGVILDGPFDPDAQATVTDFIDYTEYLPADIIRSLTLIRGLDERYLEATQGVHELTKTYGQLPDIPLDERPDALNLRKDISSHLDRAINARESAYAEACRLYNVVDRHFNRLDCIKQKLEALPKPSPAEPASSQTVPTTKRGRSGKKGDDVPAPTTRITLRLDSHDHMKSVPTLKSRTRRSVLSAEHLAGLHPDSPIASTEHSDVELESKAILSSESPADTAVAQGRKEKNGRRSRTSLGAHTHSGVANISTSNALAMLKPPPEDAKPGSEDMPWLRLTEWEMTKLRKKMKKNAVWQPSEVMIHRELALRGRGWEAYRSAKAQAETSGTEFIDVDDIMNNYIPGKLTKRSEGTKDTEGTFETKLSNRGMKLNEAKKLKRENQAREQAAAAAAEAELAAKRQGQATSPVKHSVSNGDHAQTGKGSRAAKKRKPDVSPVMDVPVAPPTEAETRTALRSSSKRRKTSDTPMESSVSALSASSTTPSTNVPTAVAEMTEAKPTPPPASPIGFKRSVPPSEPVAAPLNTEGTTTTTLPLTRPPSRRRSTAASAEPTPSIGLITAGKELRRKSATPARKTPVPDVSRAASVSAPGRRKKRPAPGPVSSGQDGGAAVSYGRRKAKPTKKRIREHGPKDGDIRIDEDGVLEEIDPNEPRYCLCGDVSFGTMICCENNDCDREWFHLDCVGLSEVPGRTAKWYCPECRVKFNKGTHGIVKIGSRR
ncbi:hypothetical protein BDV28DRAFT_129500 [Aspergillus coremiiformis]|uniref:Chromatin modification-related protein n=1 Tax=Aspergillus coremiiformis TaxID=138285 RepID=A0A5N6ZC76_9EURO|nr:hypothetical protein BDV28DRAFT_129500 [Aspergillus coremiiformis]